MPLGINKHTLCRIQEPFDVHLINNVVCEMRNWSQVRVSAVRIFDRVVKLRHKERSQYNCKNGVSDVEPPIVGGVTSHLLDRLNDTTRTFPRVLILGNYRLSFSLSLFFSLFSQPIASCGDWGNILLESRRFCSWTLLLPSGTRSKSVLTPLVQICPLE